MEGFIAASTTHEIKDNRDKTAGYTVLWVNANKYQIVIAQSDYQTAGNKVTFTVTKVNNPRITDKVLYTTIPKFNVQVYQSNKLSFYNEHAWPTLASFTPVTSGLY